MKKSVRDISLVTLGIVILVSVHFIEKKILKRDLSEIINSGRLTVLTNGSSLGFQVNDEKASGFQYELIKAFADSIGVALQITEQNDLKNELREVRDKEFDVLADFVPSSEENAEGVIFTIPILLTRLMLVQRENISSKNGVAVKKQYDLDGDTIYIPYNSPFRMRLFNLAKEIAGTIHIVELKHIDTETLVRYVAIGRIKYTVCDRQLSLKLKDEYPNINVSLPIGFTQELRWAVNADSPQLLKRLNKFLNNFIGSSDYWNLYRKYFD